MMEFRFFEIYRSVEYLELLMEGILVSAGLTLFAGLFWVLYLLLFWPLLSTGALCCSTLYVSPMLTSLEIHH